MWLLGAIQDVLEVCGALSAEENTKGKAVLDRIVAMLTRLGRRGYVVREACAEYAAGGIDTDGDSDTDPEKAGRTEQVPNKTLHQTGATEPIGRRVASRIGAGW